jgi:hypothetical protein
MSEAAADGNVVVLPVSPEVRLRVALRRLDSALAEQRDAIAAFRREMGTLATAVSNLASTTTGLQSRLDHAAWNTARARDAADILASTATEVERCL